MTSLPADPPGVIVGVDTHQDVHVAVALDALGRRLGELQIAATTSGYGQLVSWVRELGPAARFGVEGTGSYGAGLHRYLRRHGLAVVEVNRPDRSTRHRRGKSDPKWQDSSASSPPCGVHQRTPSGRSGRTWPGWTRRRQVAPLVTSPFTRMQRRAGKAVTRRRVRSTRPARRARPASERLPEVCMTTACRRSLCSGRFETLLRAGRRSSADTRAK